MAVFVEGTRGSGKSKLAVAEIQTALGMGRRVATNLNLNMDKLMPADSQASVVRLPDKPRACDLKDLGMAYEGLNPEDPSTYDENKFGLIVLDEVLTFFNSRSWNQPGRLDVVEFLVQSRKYGWRLWLIGQSVDFIDGQMRDTLVDYLYSCKSSKKIKIPVLSTIWGVISHVITAGKGLPSFHLCNVYEGVTKNKVMRHEWFFFRRNDLHACYQTAQQFKEDWLVIPGHPKPVDMRASYSMLPSSILHKWYSPQEAAPQSEEANTKPEPKPVNVFSTISKFLLIVGIGAGGYVYGIRPHSQSVAVQQQPLADAPKPVEDGPKELSGVHISCAMREFRTMGEKTYPGAYVKVCFQKGEDVFYPEYAGYTVRMVSDCLAFLEHDAAVYRVTCSPVRHYRPYVAQIEPSPAVADTPST
ncbi:zonular occludens toxin domain-containing protein [Gallaecimonas pentaromativorans]|uniref:Zonular occludens toxin Zot n=1 Tax=Gallaecimonas pentaromativorans TaxID=584787 RepID=A0A3N1PL16_9GAMM|nr:zonular occludens toxin domain-containing protein [Gallaecimonas pentaromativorans]ROQ27580.1 zonular occludens toxin Zot [Gallaecimonas pentaromativorans]